MLISDWSSDVCSSDLAGPTAKSRQPCWNPMALERPPICSPVTIVRYWTIIVPIFTHCRWGYWRMRSIGKGGISAALLTGSAWLLAGCGMVDGSRDGGPAAGPAPAPGPLVDDRPVTVGSTYMVAGPSYTPADIVDYDAVGYARRYGDGRAGQPTDNGERFERDAISPAHNTLHLPRTVAVSVPHTR